MSRSLPPLGWFRAFECAARLHSFTAAADELGMTQSAISQQIRALESRLGCRLFDRKHRGIGLTDDGRKLLPDITRAIDAISSATAPFDLPTDSNVLTVATSVSIAQWYLAPAMHQFMQCNPDVNVRLLTTVWPDEMSDATDVQIRFGPAHKTNGQTQSLGQSPRQSPQQSSGQSLWQSLGRNRLVLVASPFISEQLDTAGLLDNQLKKYPLIQAVGTSDTWANSAEKFGLSATHHVSLFVDSHGLAVDFARSNTGVALTSELIAAPSLANGSLVRLHHAAIDAADGYSIAVNSTQKIDTATLFVDWLIEQVQLLEQKLV